MQDDRIDEILQLVSKAFRDYNLSIGSPAEMVDEEFGDMETAYQAVRRYDILCCKKKMRLVYSNRDSVFVSKF